VASVGRPAIGPSARRAAPPRTPQSFGFASLGVKDSAIGLHFTSGRTLHAMPDLRGSCKHLCATDAARRSHSATRRRHTDLSDRTLCDSETVPVCIVEAGRLLTPRPVPRDRSSCITPLWPGGHLSDITRAATPAFCPIRLHLYIQRSISADQRNSARIFQP
jgi:hypothetical protein